MFVYDCRYLFLQAFLRGIMANWLVNIAIWQAMASSSLPGKVGIYVHPCTGRSPAGLKLKSLLQFSVCCERTVALSSCYSELEHCELRVLLASGTALAIRSYVRTFLANVCTLKPSLHGAQVIGAVLPILTFVAMGLEHSVANMFLIPMGMALGAPVTRHQFLVCSP